MAIKYVDSAATGANDGSSKVNAWTSILSADGAGSAAGDFIYVSHTSDETIAGDMLLNFMGINANPIKILSINFGTDAEQSGAAFGSGNNFYTNRWEGSVFVRGCMIRGGALNRLFGYTGSALAVRQHFLDCTFIDTYNSASPYSIGSDYIPQADVTFENCMFDQTFLTATTWAGFRIFDGSLVLKNPVFIFSGTPTSSNNFINSYGSHTGKVVVQDADLSLVTNLVGVAPSADAVLDAIFRRCKLKAGFVAANGTKRNANVKILLEACTDGTITVPVLGNKSFDTFYGTIASSLSRYRTGGADDGLQANAHSWEMTTNANAIEIYNSLEAPPLTRWLAPDASISGATAKGIFTSTRCAPLATPAALTTDGTSTWNGTGVGTKQKITHTLTNGSTLTVYVASGGTLNNDDFWIEVSEPDQVGGPVSVRCFLAKPSTTVYVDPRLEVA